MKFGSFLIVTLLGLTGRVWGSADIDRKSLDHLLKFYEGVSSLEADFVQTKTLADLGITLVSEGHLVLTRPSRVVWAVTKPASLRVELSGGTMTMTTSADGKSSVTKIAASRDPSQKAVKSLHDMVAWLTLDAGSLSKNYRVTQVAPNRYRFVPRAESLFVSLEMTLADLGHLKTLRIEERSRDTIVIDFKPPRVTKD